jgi:acetyltransferase-like isoleucine patch superfamily enzyme
MSEQTNNTRTGFPVGMLREMEFGKRLLLWVGLVQELVMMAGGLWPAAWLVLRFAPSAKSPSAWVLIIIGAVLLFNYGYLITLLAFRVILPRPKEGMYPVQPGRKPPYQVILFMLNLLLVKARYDPPWAAMFSSVLANTFPLGFLFARLFGPRTRSLTMGDTIHLLDPHLVEIGRQVQLGFHCTIIAHVFDNRGLHIRRVKIDDHAIIGGESTIMAGVEVGEHAVVASRSQVRPNTIIKPYEYWAGTPAKKIKDLRPGEEPASADSLVEAGGADAAETMKKGAVAASPHSYGPAH